MEQGVLLAITHSDKELQQDTLVISQRSMAENQTSSKMPVDFINFW